MATTTVSQQPDIEYAPNIDKWHTRTQWRLANETLPTELPPGFPRKLESDLVWEGQIDYNWVYELNKDELEEIEQALVHFKCMLKK